MGKGSKQRPRAIDTNTFEDNWDANILAVAISIVRDECVHCFFFFGVLLLIGGMISSFPIHT